MVRIKNLVFKDTLREISKTKTRFLSIFAIVFIGVAMFSGIFASGTDMRKSADAYFDDYNLMDLRVVSTLGITKEDIKELKKVDGLLGIQPAHTADLLAKKDNVEYVVRVSSFSISDMRDGSENYINQLVLKEGRLPEKVNECVVEYGDFMNAKFEVGDKITLYSYDSDIAETLKIDTFTIVGLVNTPYYLSFEKGSTNVGGGTVNTFMYIDDINFSMDAYTEVFMTFTGLKDLNSYKDQYFDALEPYSQHIEILSIERSEIRTNSVIDDAMEQLNSAIAEYENGKLQFETEMAKAELDIKNGEDEILLGKSQISTAKIVLESTIQTSSAQIAMLEEQVINFQKQYDQYASQFSVQAESAEKQKNSLKSQNETLEKQIAEKQSAYDELNLRIAELNNESSRLESEYEVINKALTDEMSKPLEDQDSAKILELQNELSAITLRQSEIASERMMLELSSDKIEYETIKTQIESNNSTISVIESGLTTSRQALDAAQTQLDNAMLQLSNAKSALAQQKKEQEAEIAKNEKKLKQAEKDLEEGKIKLEEERKKGEEAILEAEEEISKAKFEIEAIEDAQWYILDRNSHYSYVDYKGATERMDAIAVVFPVFFFMVAALVCSTTMTRLVDEQRSQIGTLKALGYSSYEIATKYVFYAGSATLLGSVSGLWFGMTAFPWIIYTAWNMMYILPEITYEIQPALMCLSVASSFAVTVTATLSACYKELIGSPSSLMRPKAPKLGKKILIERVGFVWSRLNFTSKVTVRNLFRYKKRMLMTIIGISGCTALLVSGFGLKDSINDIIQVQFGEIFTYDAIVSLNNDLSNSDREAISMVIKDNGFIEDTLLLHNSTATLVLDGESPSITLVATKNPEQLNKFVSLHNRSTKEEYVLSFDEVIITEKIAFDHGIKVGDEIDVMIDNGVIKTFVVGEIAENYTNHFIYMTSSLYKSTFGVKAEENVLYIKHVSELSENELAKIIADIEGTGTVASYSSFIGQFSDMITSLNFIVIVLVISAGALAFVVLYNLTNVNISERIREIATLKVLGFNKKEIENYVFKENLILTLIGGIFGLFLGKALHYVIMVVVELDHVMFGRTITTESYLISLFFTLLFGIMVNLFMRKRLTEIPMVESLKSVE